MRRFDPPTLFAALSTERERRGLTCAQVAAETGVAEAHCGAPARPGRFELDGVLAMTQWLGRPVEDFTRPGDVPPPRMR